MSESPASLAARRDRDRELFAVYPAAGGIVITASRREAVDLAASLNGTWARIPRCVTRG